MSQYVGPTKLSWDASPGAAGYVIYAGGATNTYDDPRSPWFVGNVLTVYFPVDAVGNWFFNITAHDASFVQGPLDTEISDLFIAPAGPALATQFRSFVRA